MANPLPREARSYSLVALPTPNRISAALKPSDRKLSRVDARSDGKIIFCDSPVPGGTLLGSLNVDYYTVALPIRRTHPAVGALFVAQNAYQRKALIETILRFIEEDLQMPGNR